MVFSVPQYTTVGEEDTWFLKDKKVGSFTGAQDSCSVLTVYFQTWLINYLPLPLFEPQVTGGGWSWRLSITQFSPLTHSVVTADYALILITSCSIQPKFFYCPLNFEHFCNFTFHAGVTPHNWGGWAGSGWVAVIALLCYHSDQTAHQAPYFIKYSLYRLTSNSVRTPKDHWKQSCSADHHLLCWAGLNSVGIQHENNRLSSLWFERSY